ncbi:hypothetical protein H5410_040800 [Solanum commersonii]|uniref:Uncharacterized protein n=1 Tax=Solanum commersonii TaxID=4109 RepID=A0A9J5XTM2_SOLCO|nr:hypothetical protein H5410_040800 [Solanum commersonii]
MNSFLQASHKTLSKLERKYESESENYTNVLFTLMFPLKTCKEFSIYRLQKIVLADCWARLVANFIAICVFPSASVHSESLGGILLLRRIDQQNADCSFHRLIDPSPSGLRVLEQRAECIPSANRQACLVILRLQLLHYFQPFCSFCLLSDVSNSVEQD